MSVFTYAALACAGAQGFLLFVLLAWGDGAAFTALTTLAAAVFYAMHRSSTASVGVLVRRVSELEKANDELHDEKAHLERENGTLVERVEAYRRTLGRYTEEANGG